jgi:hypothetical protein
MFDGFIDDSDRRIIVDDFDIARLRLTNLPHAERPLFFLTHAHADHLRGLSADWDYAPIYCSSVTRALVLGRFSTFRLPHLLQPIDAAERIVLKLPPLNQNNNNTVVVDDNDDIVTITALPANHIAGALMLLFQWRCGVDGEPRAVLHSGDFRFAPKMTDYEVLFGASIDRLVLDTTFLGAEWRHFPPRDASIARIIDIVAAHMAQHGADARIYLGCDNIGFEPLFEALHQRFGMRICVPSLLWRQLQDILSVQPDNVVQADDDAAAAAVADDGDWHYHDADSVRTDVYTRDPSSTSFFVVPFQLCADAARAARLDAHTLEGRLPPIVRARGTQRLNRRRRLLREGRASSPTLIATDAIGRAAFVQAARERANDNNDADADATESIETPDEWMPSTNVDRAIGVPTIAGVAESLRRMKNDVASGAALLLQASTQFFRERHTRQSEIFEGVWRVLYSNHSSRSEIEQFVRLVQPQSVHSFLRDVKPSDAIWLQNLCQKYQEEKEEEELEEEEEEAEEEAEEENDTEKTLVESSTSTSTSSTSSTSSSSSTLDDETESLLFMAPKPLVIPVESVRVSSSSSSSSESVTEIIDGTSEIQDVFSCGCKRLTTASQRSQVRRAKLTTGLQWSPRSPLSELISQSQSEVDELAVCHHKRRFVPPTKKYDLSETSD